MNIKDQIQEDVNNNNVVLFMKGNKAQPQCGFSNMVSRMLTMIEIDYKDINVLESEELRQGIKDFSDWPTIPQLYVKGEFIGGCDIIREMYETGELMEMMNTHGIDVKPQPVNEPS